MSTRALRNLCGALWDSFAPATQSKSRIRNFHSFGQSQHHVQDSISPILEARSNSDIFANYRWRLFAPQLRPKRLTPSLPIGTPTGRSRYVLSRGFGAGFMCLQGVPESVVTSTGPGPIATAVGACSAVTGERTSGGCTQCGRVGGKVPKGIDRSMIAMLAAGGLEKSTSTTRRGRLRPLLTSKKLKARPAGSAGGSGSTPGGSGGAAAGGFPAGGGAGRRLGGRNSNNGSRNGNGDGNSKNGTSPPLEEPTSTEPGILGRIASIHRPTKDQMLAAANGVFARFRIRTKWALIRQMRPYNLEDIAALLQWLLVGHIIWVVVGTTTFFSIVLLLVNTVYAQESLTSMIGNYLTRETGVRIVFESAIVPRWKDGRISLKNVFASRRPGNVKDKSKKNVQKGSSATAAAIAAAAIHADGTSKGTEYTTQIQDEEEEEDTNYTQFDVTIDEVAVTLSLARWMNGKGLLKDVQVKGVRGVVDRTHVVWEEGVDPRSYRHVHQPGDFAIESFKLEDFLVTVYEPDGFRPFSVSIYNCDLPQLRKQWLFYDFLSANNMSGSFDHSLFTIHPRQRHGISPSQQLLHGEGEDRITWKKISRLRIDGLKIDHLNRGVEGPFGWIKEGSVDIVADILFPEDEDELAFSKVVQEIVDRVEKTVSSSTTTTPSPLTESLSLDNLRSIFQPDNLHSLFQLDNLRFLLQSITSPPAPPPPTIRLPPSPPAQEEKEPSTEGSSSTNSNEKKEDNRFIVLDLHIQLFSVRAAVPLFTKDLSYVNSALIRPIVAYINSRQTYIPIQCRVVKRTSEFDGSWTVYDSGLMDDLSAETYEAFAAHVMDRQARRRRFRKVGLWSLQLMAQAVLMAMAGNLA